MYRTVVILISGLFILCGCGDKSEMDRIKNEPKFLFDYRIDDTKDSTNMIIYGKIKIQIKGFSETPLKYGIADNEGYTKRLNYYLNEARRDIQVQLGERNIELVSYQFEHNQNLTNFETILFSCFIPKTAEGDIEILYNDRVFNSGIEKFIIHIK